MKKLILTLVILLFLGALYYFTDSPPTPEALATPSGLMMTTATVTGSAPAASCNATPEITIDTQNSYLFLGRLSNDKMYYAQPFTPSTTYNVCEIDLNLYATGTPPFDLNLYIYDNNTTPSDRPGSIVYASSTTKTASEIGAAYEWVPFLFSNVEVVGSTKYWIVIKSSGFDADSANYIRVGRDLNGTVLRGSPEIIDWNYSVASDINIKVHLYE